MRNESPPSRPISFAPSVGDWINSYSPGIWRVYRLLDGFNELRFSLDKRKKPSKRVIVFSKRLVDAKWKRALGAELCERSIVRALSAQDRQRVEELLLADAELRSSFEEYSPEPLPLIINLAMSLPDRSRLESFGETTLAREITDGIPLDRVLVLLTEYELAQYLGKTPFNATLQLVCRDHEVRDREFILRDWRVLPF